METQRLHRISESINDQRMAFYSVSYLGCWPDDATRVPQYVVVPFVVVDGRFVAVDVAVPYWWVGDEGLAPCPNQWWHARSRDRCSRECFPCHAFTMLQRDYPMATEDMHEVVWREWTEREVKSEAARFGADVDRIRFYVHDRMQQAEEDWL